ncbi:MAG: MATE family efflux transporter [Schaedlerella sp.]|nr:MATE family efflux transporter [Schaedlerella sp.]
MSQTIIRENKMGTLPVPKLLISMSLPMIISMLVQALYNIVDSMFVAQINEAALTAVSLAFPIQNLMIAIATGTGVGINALLSRNLGEKNFKSANLAAKNGIFLAFMSYILMVIIGGTSSGLFFASQTKDALIAEYGTQYLRIVTVVSAGLFFAITFSRLLQATGKTVYAMVAQATGAITNIILDPILIFGYFGLPAMGVSGAAIATVIGQFIELGLALYFNVRFNHELNLNMRKFRPDLRIIGTIYRVGIPSIIMASISSVMVFGFNKILLAFSSTAAAVLGIYFKLQSFVFMPVFGLNNGMIPIIAYNYGARNKKRILSTMKLSVVIATSFMFIGIAAFELIPGRLFALFDASANMLEIGIPALRIIGAHFVFAGFNIITASVFQALGNGVYSLITSVTRQLVVILPLAYIFAQLFGLSSVWWAFIFAEFVAVMMNIILFRKIKKEKIDSLDLPLA